jgi:hypothetical protein
VAIRLIGHDIQPPSNTKEGQGTMTKSQRGEPTPLGPGDYHQTGRLNRERRASGGGEGPGRHVGSCRASIGFLVLALASLASLPAKAGIEPNSTTADRSIAADAVACVEIPQPVRLIDRGTDPRFQDYLKLFPQYQRLLKHPKFSEASAVVKLIASQLGTTWENALRELTGGGITAALEADPGQQPRVYVIITTRNRELLERASQVLLNLARQDATNKGKPDPVKTSDHRGVVVHALGGAEGPAYGLVADKLVLANSAKSLERVIDRMVPAAAKPGEPAVSGKASFRSLAERAEWTALKKKQDADSLAWGFADMDRLRQLDPKRYGSSNKPDTGQIVLFGSWIQAIQKAPWLTAGIRWSNSELGAAIDLPVPKDGRAPAYKGYVPGSGQGAAPLIQPPGTIASLSIWRDMETFWESRADLFAPETVQGFAQLDTLAGQFFGGREFGSDVLGQFDPHWRLIVAQQDYAALKPQPDVKYPAVAMVAELDSADSDFGERFKVAFQAIVGISNVDGNQKKAAALELGSEDVEGIKLATARFMIPRHSASASEAPSPRYNFTPATAQVGKYLIFSSSTGLARDLIKELKSRSEGADASETAVLEADGLELAKLLGINRARLATQLMLGRGETKEKADGHVELGLALLRSLGHGRLVIRDDPGATRIQLKIQFAR